MAANGRVQRRHAVLLALGRAALVRALGSAARSRALYGSRIAGTICLAAWTQVAALRAFSNSHQSAISDRRSIDHQFGVQLPPPSHPQRARQSKSVRSELACLTRRLSAGLALRI